MFALLVAVSSVNVASAADKSVLYIDDGILTSVSDAGVLKIDTVTGDMHLVTKGERGSSEYFFPATGAKLEKPAVTNGLFFLGSKPEGSAKAVGDCSFKQESLAVATRLVVLMCGAGGSGGMGCAAARSAAAEAWNDFQLCANNLPEPT